MGKATGGMAYMDRSGRDINSRMSRAILDTAAESGGWMDGARSMYGGSEDSGTPGRRGQATAARARAVSTQELRLKVSRRKSKDEVEWGGPSPSCAVGDVG